MKSISTEIAKLLLSIGAITVNTKKPYRYTSGILSPIYTDNRLVMSYPKVRKKIADAYVKVIKEKVGLKNVDVVSGTAMAAIPQAAWVSERLDVPMVFVRPSKKEHGKENKVEGIFKKGSKVLIVEDLISTGGSSIDNKIAVENLGGKVKYAVATFTYEMESAEKAFKENKLKVFTLTNITDLLETAVKLGTLKENEVELVKSWTKDTTGWGKKMGFE